MYVKTPSEHMLHKCSRSTHHQTLHGVLLNKLRKNRDKWQQKSVLLSCAKENWQLDTDIGVAFPFIYQAKPSLLLDAYSSSSSPSTYATTTSTYASNTNAYGSVYLVQYARQHGKKGTKFGVVHSIASFSSIT